MRLERVIIKLHRRRCSVLCAFAFASRIVDVPRGFEYRAFLWFLLHSVLGLAAFASQRKKRYPVHIKMKLFALGV